MASTSDLEHLLGLTTAVLWAFDADGRCTVSRGGGLRSLGLEDGCYEGLNLFDLYPPGTPAGDAILRALSGEAFTTDYERADGTVVQTSYVPRRDEAGALIGGLAFTVDVSHRRLEEQEAHRAAVLAQISRELADHAQRSPQALAQVIAEKVVELVGGTSLVVEFDDAGVFTDRYAVAGRDPELLDAIRRAIPLWRSILGWSAGEESLLGGQPLYLEELPPELVALMDERLGEQLAAALDIAGLMLAPTRDVGRVNGVIVVLRRPDTPKPTELDCQLFEEVAERAGLALSNARLIQTAQQLMADRHSLLGHLIDAEEAERRRIAHDIHDDTIQVLAAVDLRLQLLRRKVSARPDGDAELEVLDSLRESTQAATSRLRRLLFELQPPALESAGVGAALRQLANDLYADSGIDCTITDGLTAPPEESTASVVFRVGKEALVNARKHAGATNVQVILKNEGGGVRLTVVDDGVGLPAGDTRPDNWPHLGLETMRDRAHLAGGSLTLSGGPGQGTVVDLWVPDVRPAR